VQFDIDGVPVTVRTFPTVVDGDLALLDEAERAAAARFVRTADRLRYVGAHVALRLVLAEETGLAAGSLAFRRAPCPGCGGPHGRPELVQGGPAFSLTHAGEYAMVATTSVPGRAVGVDLEQSHDDPRLVDDLAVSLHASEREELDLLDAAERPAAVVRCWVRKEAVLKALGTGIAAGVDTTCVGTGVRPVRAGVADVAAPEGYVAAVAVR
jgi:4'-phosphopantetheinyl transferase